MSQNLKVETGRWRRQPRAERVCQCDREKVQDEKHVLLECTLTADGTCTAEVPDAPIGIAELFTEM